MPHPVNELNLSRSIQHFDPNASFGVDIVGAGATGSRIFEQLICMGVTDINISDFDHVESHNIGNQVYTHSDVGKSKVSALRAFTKRKLGYVPDGINFYNEKVNHNGVAIPRAHRKYRVLPSGRKSRSFAYKRFTDPVEDRMRVLFLLVDSMSARRGVYTTMTCSDMYKGYAAVIETRMGASHGFVYSFDPETQGARWKNTLFDDSEAQDVGACGTQLSIAATANMLAGLAVSSYINFSKQADVPFLQEIYTNPFFYSTED